MNTYISPSYFHWPLKIFGKQSNVESLFSSVDLYDSHDTSFWGYHKIGGVMGFVLYSFFKL